MTPPTPPRPDRTPRSPSLAASDRRRCPRALVRCEATVVRGAQLAVGTTENVGRRGAKLVLDIEPPLCVGERVRIWLAPMTGIGSCHAEVRWVHPMEPHRFGVIFLSSFKDGPASRTPESRSIGWRQGGSNP